MDELEKLEKAIEGVQAKIQLQKASNQKLRDELNNISMDKQKQMQEVSRLKDTNITLQNNIESKKKQIADDTGKQEMSNLLDGLGGLIR